MIYGSETGSIVQSRGIYHFPYQQSVLADVGMNSVLLLEIPLQAGGQNPQRPVFWQSGIIHIPAGSLSGQALITLESQRLITPEILTLDRLTQRAFQRIPTIYIRKPGRIIRRILWCIFSLIGILMKGSLLICVFVPMRRQWECFQWEEPGNLYH